MISHKAEYKREDYHHARTRDDAAYRDLERTQPLESWGHGILQAVAYLGLIIAAWVILAMLAPVMP
jgi:hypothetical protein